MFDDVPIAEVRDYWDERPCNIRHSREPVGTRGYFDQVEARKYLVEPHIPGFAQFPRWAGKRVLEVGCGIGTDTVNFARSGALVTAVDLSSSSLEVARRRAEVFDLADRICFYQGDAESLDSVVPVEPYDLVYSFGVVHHTPHPERALAQMRRYVGPSGVAKIMVYNRWSWKVAGIVLRYGNGRVWDAGPLVARYSEAQTGCPVTYTYSRRAAHELLERAGFRLTEMRVEHIFPYKVKDYTQYQYVRTPLFRYLPNSVFRPLERTVGWHLLMTGEAA
jgi:ubiquinone/menaquinone biosynthesis C-methylase UbiE